MAFYKTQIAETGAGYAVDNFGRRLKFIGNYPCQAGDYVWTDGNVIFGNISTKPQPVIFDENNGGIPVLANQLRGYFNSSGYFQNYDIRYCNSFVNNDKFFSAIPNNREFIHELPDDAQEIITLNIFDADIASGGRLLTLCTEKNGVADYLKGEFLSIYSYLNDSQLSTFTIDVNNDIEADVQDIFDDTENAFRYSSDEPENFEYKNFLTQLLLGKINSVGQDQIIFGTYASADFTPNDNEKSFAPSVKFTPDSKNFVYDFKDTCNIDDDFSWVKSKYTEDNLYLDNDITATETERPFYVTMRNFRKDHDKFLIPAFIKLCNYALKNPVSTFEVEAYHLDENYPIPDYVPNIQSERFFYTDSSQKIKKLFKHNTVKYQISMEQGNINRASQWEISNFYLNQQDPNKPLTGVINPYGPIVEVSDTRRRVVQIMPDSQEHASRSIGLVAIIKDLKNNEIFPELENVSGVIYRYTDKDNNPVMLNNSVFTYKCYPLVNNGGVIIGIVYTFFAVKISAPFQDVYSTSNTIHISFDATDLSNNNQKWNNWIVNSDECFYSYIDDSLVSQVDIQFAKNLSMPYRVFHKDNYHMRSLFAINSNYDYETDIPDGGRWQPVENISVSQFSNGKTQFRNGKYLVGIHGDKLFQLDSLNTYAQPEPLGYNLKNFRLNELKNISKAR